MTRQELLQYNYTKGGNNYILMGNAQWIAFTKSIIENKLIPHFGTDFNLVIYWFNSFAKDTIDFICVPYSKVSHLLIEDHLTDKNTKKARWNFIIKDGLLCVHANTNFSIDINPYLNVLNQKEPKQSQFNLSGEEGSIKYALHKSIERDSQLIANLKSKRKLSDPLLHCEVCGFSFSEKYGDIGEGFIEAHHILPLSSLNQSTITQEKDLVLICSNCHRMLHRANPVLDYKKLKNLLHLQHH